MDDKYIDADISLSASTWTILEHFAEIWGVSVDEAIGRILHDKLDELKFLHDIEVEAQDGDKD